MSIEPDYGYGTHTQTQTNIVAHAGAKPKPKPEPEPWKSRCKKLLFISCYFVLFQRAVNGEQTGKGGCGDWARSGHQQAGSCN